MCLDDAFRLCSCDADQLAPTEIGWIMEVVDPSKPKKPKKGKLKVPAAWTEAELQNVASILTQLNSGACFDFDIDTATQQYRLQIRTRVQSEWLTFFCGGGEWKHVSCPDKFAAYRTQLVQVNQGKIEAARQTSGSSQGSTDHMAPTTDGVV